MGRFEFPGCMAAGFEGITFDYLPTKCQIDAIENAGIKSKIGNAMLTLCLKAFDETNCQLVYDHDNSKFEDPCPFGNVIHQAPKPSIPQTGAYKEPGEVIEWQPPIKPPPAGA